MNIDIKMDTNTGRGLSVDKFVQREFFVHITDYKRPEGP